MKFVPGDYHYWWTTRTRRNPRIEDGPELASGAFHYDERYRPTFRQREDGGVSIFLRYPLSEQPVLHGCAVKPPGADTPEELTEEAFINHDDGVAELRYPGDFRTQNAPPLSNGRYTFQWYRVQTDGGHKAIPPAPIASPGEFEINDGEVLHNAYEEDEWWPRYLTVGRQPLLVLRNLAGRAVHGFRCEIEGDGVRYVADQAEMEERLGLLQPYELPHPSDKTDFAFPGAFGAPALTQWELGEYTVTWYAWRELPGSAFGVEPYELLQHKLVIGRGGTVQL
jgi:hypothetical protein